MTYTHALQYLNAPPSVSNEKTASSTLFQACLDKASRSSRKWIPVYLSGDRSGHATALFLANILRKAEVPFAHLIEGEDLPTAERFLLNEAPILSTVLSAYCHQVRNLETITRRALSRSLGNAPVPPLSGVERCLLALPPLFEEAGCDVILLEGDHHLPLLHAWPEYFRDSRPGMMLVSGANSALQLPIGRIDTNMISTPCGPDAFRLLSDACAQYDRRLCMIATTNGRRYDIAPASQRLDYRKFEGALLRSGVPSFAQSAMLAVEGVILLRKCGIFLPEPAIRDGLNATWVPDYFQPRSIDPILLTHRVTDQEDVGVLLSDLTELASLLPAPRLLYTEPEYTSLLSSLDSLYTIVTEAEPSAEFSTIILGRTDHLHRVITEWKVQKRSL